MNRFENNTEDTMPSAAAIASVLTRLIDGNRRQQNAWLRLGVGSATTRFDSAYAPEISVQAYVERIQKYSKVSCSVYVIALIYIDRLIETEGFLVTELNVHRLFITSILLAAKFYDDEFFKNAFYATLGGIDSQEMNLLEVDLLNLLKFALFVTPDAHAACCAHVQRCERQSMSLPQFYPHSPSSVSSLGHTNSSYLSSVFDGPTSCWASATAAPVGTVMASSYEQQMQQDVKAQHVHVWGQAV